MKTVRVLYSFPHKIGASRICYTAWQQVNGLASAGAEVMVHTGGVRRALPPQVGVRCTLSVASLSAPYRLVGQHRALAIHDAIVARRLPKLASSIDVVHTWPSGALRSLRAAKQLGIPTVLERPNAHTRFAYEVVREECQRLGVELPPDHEHAYNAHLLRHEEEEYDLADYLLCPSDFVVRSFLDQGVPCEKLIRHIYGYDESIYRPPAEPRPSGGALTVLFVGVAAVRKGLHYALEAWAQSPASRDGTFLIAGEFLPAYRQRLSRLLDDPSVHVLGHRDDVPALMKEADILVLPSIEEGFGLVCAEALGSGCVPLVSDACTDACRHNENSLVHRVGDVAALTEHLTALREDPQLLERLRAGALRTAPSVTWSQAGVRLLAAYREALSRSHARGLKTMSA